MTTLRLRPVLEWEHRQWIQEVMAVLERAERSGAGPWARWNAIRYLQTTFPARLEKERRLVDEVVPDLSEEKREILWALGELLDSLCLNLDHLIGLCHRATEFSAVTGKIVNALRHWCRALEEDPEPRAVIPRQSCEVLAQLPPETATAGV